MTTAGFLCTLLAGWKGLEDKQPRDTLRGYFPGEDLTITSCCSQIGEMIAQGSMDVRYQGNSLMAGCGPECVITSLVFADRRFSAGSPVESMREWRAGVAEEW